MFKCSSPGQIGTPKFSFPDHDCSWPGVILWEIMLKCWNIRIKQSCHHDRNSYLFAYYYYYNYHYRQRLLSH